MIPRYLGKGWILITFVSVNATAVGTSVSRSDGDRCSSRASAGR